ncbi:hypothetical protein HDF16_000255 [Granulicella aggregans]|uniref:TonB-dependent transporter Oar-like beta-barrel domain-containing protein n=1 Tax=Granulicella aggregans TaxID=474949 RepID=A0A7W7ZA62_9BACT|nr:TonB-dependent receptor [Granulicella aggregans]MBB5055586.1 hypothetical protein [Granulicella aggregans]
MMKRWIQMLSCGLMLLLAVAANAQTARFSGQISDAQGAVITGAQIQVLNLDTGTILSARSDGEGHFTVPFLAAGHYRVDVVKDGFSSVSSADITLGVGQVFVYDAQLQVGNLKTDVSVEASAITQVETQNAEIAGTITGREVTSIGLNGRNFVQFIDLVPGVSNQTQQDEAKVGQAGSVAYSVNGGRTEYNSFSIDGSETLNTGINKDHSTLIVTPSIDAIQEIKVLTSNYGAQYPSTGSGTTIVTTKSGTDKLHGNLFEFLRNEAFNAKGYFDVTKGAPLYRRNDFGGTIGGPIVIPKVYDGRGKTHFFFSEEARTEKSPTPYRQAVPSYAERLGDFSDVCPAGYNDTSVTVDKSKYPDCPVVGAGFNGAAIGQINRNAQAILNTGIIPAPNATSGCNSTVGSCYNVDVSLPTYYREELFRFDHAINSKVQASFRYIHDEWDETTPVPPYSFLQNSFPTIQSRYYGPGLSMAARVTASLTPTLLNEFVVSFTNSRIKLSNVHGANVSIQRPAALDAPCAVDPNFDSGQTAAVLIQCPATTIFANGSKGLDGVAKLPGISISGNNAEYGGLGFNADPAYLPWTHTNPVYSFADNITKVLGKHSLQFGAQWVIYQRNQDNTPIGAATGETQGIYTFNNVKYGLTGNSFADFLYNRPQQNIPLPGDPGFNAAGESSGGVFSFQQDSGQTRYRERYQIIEPYLQDDFKVSSRLTINAGLRVSLFGNFHTANDNVYNWNQKYFSNTVAASLQVNPLTGELVDKSTGISFALNPANPQSGLDPRVFNGLSRCGTGGVPGSCASSHWFNPSPRIGFAWDVFGQGKTSLRGGYGVFFEHGTADEANTGSLEGSSPIVLDMTALNVGSWSNAGRNVAYPLNVTAIPFKQIWPYVQQWSVSVQQELPKGTLASLAYVGSKGTHLALERQLNQLQPISAGQNPFGAGQPLVRSGYNAFAPTTPIGDCSYTGSGDSLSFVTTNGTVVGASDAAFPNMQAACFGTGSNNGTGFAANPVAVQPNALRKFAPGLGEIYSLEDIANSNYGALQATARRTAANLTLGVAYTYSHSFDNASDRSDATFVNSYDVRANRASSNFDQRHLLHVSYVYQVPLLAMWQHFVSNINADPDPEDATVPDRPPSAYANSAVAKQILNGWELSGITLFETGIPFTVINNGSPAGISTLDNAGVANGQGAGSYPDLIGNPYGRRPTGGTNAQSVGPLLLNPGAFAAPRGLSFGNAGRNSLRNPRRTNSDVSLVKNFAISERYSLQFRSEAFNVFNQTQFRIYDPLLGNQAQNTLSCFGPYATGYSGAGGDGTSCLTGSSFLHPVDAHRPRTLQLALKLAF